MTNEDVFKEKVIALRPVRALDVGCGCGNFTATLAPYCGTIIAVDPWSSFQKQQPKPNISYLCADGRALPFGNGQFDLVWEKNSLHHVEEWERVLDEMVRVSSKYLLIEENVDDPRSEEKRNTIAAQGLFLEVQKEANYSHYRHLPAESLTDYFQDKSMNVEPHMIKLDQRIEVEDYFQDFETFAERSGRRDYWLKRRDDFKMQLAGKALCYSDHLIIMCRKQK